MNKDTYTKQLEDQIHAMEEQVAITDSELASTQETTNFFREITRIFLARIINSAYIASYDDLDKSNRSEHEADIISIICTLSYDIIKVEYTTDAIMAMLDDLVSRVNHPQLTNSYQQVKELIKEIVEDYINEI